MMLMHTLSVLGAMVHHPAPPSWDQSTLLPSLLVQGGFEVGSAQLSLPGTCPQLKTAAWPKVTPPSRGNFHSDCLV